MKSLISEFSYGFALTHELVSNLGSLSAAPIFPSLIEEGKAGGGYDVKLDSPGMPLFIQFKRSECIIGRNSREIIAGAPLVRPYYRITITGNRDSDQHDMLIELDQHPNIVLYAAPLFHMKEEFDHAFLTGLVRQCSFFVKPSTIGSFSDEAPHHVSFDGTHCVLMSKPKVIEGFGVVELEEMLSGRLSEDKRAFRDVIPEALQEADSARIRARTKSMQRGQEDQFDGLSVPSEPPESTIEAFRKRQEQGMLPALEKPTDQKPEIDQLRRLADIGLRDFNAQLYVVQRRS